MGEMVPMKAKVENVRTLLEARKEQIRLALPKHLTADRLLRVSLNAVIRTPKLLDCSQASLIGTIMECAMLGLEPDCLGQAYIIPYGDRATLVIGYKGLLSLARRSGEIASIQVGVVHEKDHFEYRRGLDPILNHVESDEPDPGRVTHFWAVATIKGGGAQFEVMRAAEVNKIRDNSPSARQKTSPWTTHYEEMGKKTVLRRLCKLLPASIEVQRAVEIDELADSGLPQHLGGEIDVTPAPEPQAQLSEGDHKAILDEAQAKVDARKADLAKAPAPSNTSAPKCMDCGKTPNHPNHDTKNADAHPFAAEQPELGDARGF